MPELPDVEMFARQAEKARGQNITFFRIHNKKFVKDEEDNLSVVGKKIRKIFRKGKYLFLYTAEKTGLAMHFGMTGFLKYHKEEQVPEYSLCSLVLENGQALSYASRRKLGSVKIKEDIEDHIKKLNLGTDALEIGQEEFLNLFEKKNTMIKALLTDQSLVCGIGNVYADEILYQAGIHPRQKTEKMNYDQKKKLFLLIRKVLKTAIHKEADVSKFPASFFLTFRKEGKPCQKCEGEVQKTSISGRSTYFCLQCQPIIE
jgi:formamidopyrimidine-DNA glycosylase